MMESLLGKDGGNQIRIQNVVASVIMRQTFDLEAIVKNFSDVEYRPKVFPGLVLRLKKPKTATLIFNSGRMVCTGAKSEKEARKAVEKVVKRLKLGGLIIKGKPEIKIQNIVASGKLSGRVDLVELCNRAHLGGRLMYEPEQFPAAIYRMDNPKVVLLVFSTGRIVCTGAKKESEVNEAVRKLQRSLEEINVLGEVDLQQVELEKLR
jgi:transcription initiation factor TFIID TATA-box-binding protein